MPLGASLSLGVSRPIGIGNIHALWCQEPSCPLWGHDFL